MEKIDSVRSYDSKILTQIKGISVNEWFVEVTVYIRMGVDSSVSIATCYGLDGSGIESRWRRDFPHSPTPALHPSSLLCSG